MTFSWFVWLLTVAIGFTSSERYSGPRHSLGVDGAACSGDDCMVDLCCGESLRVAVGLVTLLVDLCTHA